MPRELLKWFKEAIQSDANNFILHFMKQTVYFQEARELQSKAESSKLSQIKVQETEKERNKNIW